ncbi:MAG TPA: rhodanese-like domain-containing protein [Candidatus Methanoperedens sp.]|nr:rhodanese-like domain-containing protein [Candidatus Methanoperedens sp.]
MKKWLLALAVVLLPALARAQEVKLPEGVAAVGTDELKGLLDRGGKVVLINSMSALEFTQTKIKGSVNIPYGKLRDGEAKLPEDKEAVLVFYCLGPS